jgi:hypothetical protein
LFAPALRQAMELLRAPTLAGAMRQRPLPDDILTLIRIAAGESETIEPAASEMDEPPERIREAAVLYLQSVVFISGADHYRTLAVERDAPQEKLRLHLSWLMKWLHPDRASSEWESAFARRVLIAWDALKTRDRRAAYSAFLAAPTPVRGGLPVVRRAHKPSGRGAAWRATRRVGAPARRGRVRGVVTVALCLVLATIAWVASGGISGWKGQRAAASADDDGIGVVSALSGRAMPPAVVEKDADDR